MLIITTWLIFNAWLDSEYMSHIVLDIHQFTKVFLPSYLWDLEELGTIQTLWQQVARRDLSQLLTWVLQNIFWHQLEKKWDISDFCGSSFPLCAHPTHFIHKQHT